MLIEGAGMIHSNEANSQKSINQPNQAGIEAREKIFDRCLE
jgi:hypothetical protein